MKIDSTDQEILKLLADGHKVKEIGQKVNLSQKTIEGRIARAKKRNQCRTMAQLLAKFMVV